MKMVMAILHRDDEDETISELHKNKFFVTKLSTTGGLLKNKSTTILTVTDDAKVPMVMEIIKKNSGERKTVSYANPTLIPGKGCVGTFPMVPIDIQVGGSTVFVLNVEDFQKY